jgi:hypothetical protein
MVGIADRDLLRTFARLPATLTAEAARAQLSRLAPGSRYGVVVDEDGRARACLHERQLEDWPAGETLAALAAQWPPLVALPESQATGVRDVALFFYTTLRQALAPGAVILVDAEDRPVALLTRRLLDGARQALSEAVFKGLAGLSPIRKMEYLETLNPYSITLARESAAPGAFTTETVGVPVRTDLMVQRYSRLDLPGQVPVGQPATLTVAINRQVTAGAQGQVELALRAESWPLKVTAELVNPEPDFVVTGPAGQVIFVPKDADSDAYTFTLTPQSLGEKTIRMRFLQGSRWLATTRITTTVVGAAAASPGPARVEYPPAIASVGPAPDFTILIDRQSERGYTVSVAAAGAGDGQMPVKVGLLPLDGLDPAQYMQRAYAELNATVPAGAAAAGFADTVEKIGNNLFQELFSTPEARDYYWSKMYEATANISAETGAAANTFAETVMRGAQPAAVPVVQIISEEPYIPWELLRPYRKGDAQHKAFVDPNYLCERFALARGLSPGAAAPDRLAILSIAIVAPPSNLAYVQAEVDALAGLAGRYGLAVQTLRTRRDVLDFLENGEAQVLHFACHGKFNLAAADTSFVRLGDDRLEASDITGRWTNFGRFRPLVFMNCCDSGQQGLGLTGLDGWAERFLGAAGAGFFIGSLWKTTDELASKFAAEFYTRLLGGATVAEALRLARTAVKVPGRGDATYLSYAAWANPATQGRPAGAAAAAAPQQPGGSHG